ncbi:hypothetical protein SBA5_70022 [Candidatus Sulfotelmatomonas gaucii]|uniref:Uncharacterized protein n=1 Tax=Candidatus Sulfuritelmatomonas gaucii TaxID=2043161 RepID=A0A2N9M071_9BACT|nr:hypothetical protein SBA5_70022 [Candidatus Sulfotelmatomonas gaucii]
MMYRPLEERPASLSNTGHPARATANERPSKGKSLPGSLQPEQRKAATLHLAGRPVTKAGFETPLRGVAFLTFGITSTRPLLKKLLSTSRTCHAPGFAVLSELPIKRLTRATRAWVEQARRRAKQISPGTSVHSDIRGEGSHRKGHHLRKAERRAE